jgi:hypothetical protein
MSRDDWAIVTALTPDYLGKLKWTLPTWWMKPQFKDRHLYIFISGFDDPEGDLGWIQEYYPHLDLIEWSMDEAENQRELMLSSFVLGTAKCVTEPGFVKLDADCFFTNCEDVFTAKDMERDLCAHKWGYTKPGWWMDAMAAWCDGREYNGDKSDKGSRGCDRIISFCCWHKTAFVQRFAEACGSRLPIPSHDSSLWYVAERFDDATWSRPNLKKRGVSHTGRWKKIREEVCSSETAWNPSLNRTLLQHVQLEITTDCNLACPNCDRVCGLAKSDEHMTRRQVQEFVEQSLDLGWEWGRIDIIGGEPTLHPHLPEICDIIGRYKEKVPSCKVRLSSNGTGDKVKAVLKEVPSWVQVRNSQKEKGKPSFDAAQDAPCDNGITHARACSIPWRCGIGLSRYGYFPCGAGASIARVFGLPFGIKHLSEVTPEALRDQTQKLCNFCGHSRSCATSVQQQVISETWRKALDRYPPREMETL